ncbi:hypothetical protein SYNPS1DRAFT_27180 [Syncephalis pseudoplumigaleata]|uniref:U3 small nucleolar RNA-associated protein 10 n=1 Tax=Syncephalis pseudoplumigaleata TaxID=1712513 RepID=A0A4P9Z677_9FUNG|nr:hypothetical protein SYNPS1DRAFT_27180 [Syncephalis pseudoplumigaleata]|eukprot:RKP27160.1 hypothetical protein SYNPS1DRAFT_27180 [Syncephalis pseudoplumigaleata]
MASLSAQLARIATTEKRGTDKFATSFLFDAKQAADYDLDSIYDLGCTGLTELEQLDKQRFAPFRKTLFSTSMKGYDRTLKTQDENSQLDASIGLFMQCLSQYFLTRSAGKCIEWLLRRFRVNEFNTNALLACALPFHETSQFAKLASLMKFSDNDLWSFIRALRRPIRPLARTILVERCTREPSLLRVIGDQMISAAKRGLAHKTQYNFYLATAVLTIKRAPHVTDNLITLLLPDISYGLSPSLSDDQSRVVALMLLSQLASRTTFSPSALAELLASIAATMPKSRTEAQLESMLCLLHLTNCQEAAADAFSQKLVANLLAVPNLVANVLLPCASKYDASSFIRLFYKALIGMNTPQGWKEAEEVLRTIPLSNALVEFAVKQLLEHVVASQSSNKEASAACLERLRLLYTDTVTMTIEAVLKDAHYTREEHDALYTYLASTLKGTGQQLVEKTGTPLFLALNHADADIRMLAIGQLAELMQKQSPSSQNASDTEFIRKVLLDRLQSEDDKDTIASVLALPKLDQWLSFDALFAALSTLIRAENDCSPIAAQYMARHMSSKQHKAHWEPILELMLPLLLQPSDSTLPSDVAHSGLPRHAILNGYIELVDKHRGEPSYNAAYVQLLAKHMVKQDKLGMLLDYLKRGNDRAVLLALLATQHWLEHTKHDQALQLKYALLFTQQITHLLHERLAHRNFSSLAGELLDSVTNLPLEHSTTKLFNKLAEADDLADFLPVAIAWSLHCIVEQLAPPPSTATTTTTTPVCWHDQSVDEANSDSQYGAIIRQVFMAIHQEEDMSPFKVVVKVLFTRHLATAPLAFLSSIWAQPDVPQLTRMRCLDIARVYWAGYMRSTKTAVDFQLYLPWLMVALCDADAALRRLAMRCLESIHSAYMSLTSSNAAVDGGSQGKKKKKKRDVLAAVYDQTLLYGTVASERLLYLPTHEAMLLAGKLLEKRAEINVDAECLPKYLATLLDPSNDASPLKLRFLSPLILTSSLSVPFIQEVIRCYDVVSAVQLNVKGSNATKALLSLLTGSISSTQLSDTDRHQLQLDVLSVIDRPFFAVLTEPRQQQLFSQLVQLTLVHHTNIAMEARRIIKDVDATSVVVVHELLQCQQILVHQTAGASLPAQQVAKRSKASDDDHDTGLKSSAMATAIQRVTVVLELIQHRNMTGDEMQLLDASRVRVDLVVQCLRSTSNPQIHGQALLLLASLASVQPDLVLQNIMPVFTFMGASVLRQDDNYSFHIIQQTLERIIPPLLSTHSEQNMRGLMGIFVDALFHIPRHRRLPLFTVLVNTLGAEHSLHQVLLLLLVKYAERMSKSTEDTDTLMAFCLHLSEQCSAATQLKMLHQLVTALNTSPNELTDDMPELLK